MEHRARKVVVPRHRHLHYGNAALVSELGESLRNTVQILDACCGSGMAFSRDYYVFGGLETWTKLT